MQPRRHAFLFLRGEVCFHHRAVPALFDECGETRIALARGECNRMLGRNGHERRAKDRVRARSEHFEHTVGLHAPRVSGAYGKWISQPSLRPIQFSCMVRTCAGQPSRSFLTCSSNSSAYRVMAR